jgi:Na+/phosphate symporter
LAVPPAESPSTKNNSFSLGSFDWAGVNLPESNSGCLPAFFKRLTSSLALRAAILASRLTNAFSIILSAYFLFSSNQYMNFFSKTFFTAVYASCVNNLFLV